MLNLGGNVAPQIGPIPAAIGRHYARENPRRFDVFLHDGDGNIGAVRKVRSHHLVIYIENARDFIKVLPDNRVGEVIFQHSCREA
jgi:hypothetical protein